MCAEFKTSNLDPGGFAEYVRVPARQRRATPPSACRRTSATRPRRSWSRWRAACGRCGAPACSRATPRSSSGLGLDRLSLRPAAQARRRGASSAADPLADRVRVSRARLGADAAGPAESAAAGRARAERAAAAPTRCIVTGGGADVLPWAADVLRDGGAVHYFAGGAGDTLPLPLETLYHRELTITATYSSSPADLAEAFRLIAGGAIEVERLDHPPRAARAAWPSGVDLMRRREALKVYVTP